MDVLLARSDLLVIAVYLFSTLVIAWRVASKSRDVEGYTVGGRKMPGWAVGLSVLGTFLSSLTFLGVPAKCYEQGNWNAYVFGMALPIAALVAVRYFVPLYRQGASRLTAYQLLEERFGYWARLYGAASYLLLQWIRVGTVLLLVAFAVEPLLDWPLPPDWIDGWAGENWTDAKIVGILIGLGTLVIVYDTIGGISAVIWTDVVQVVVLTVGVVWCLAELIHFWPGGATAFFEAVPKERLSLGEWFNWNPQTRVWDWTLPTVFVMFVYGLSENIRNYGADQQYVQRMLAAESDGQARRAMWIGSLSYLPISALFCLIGTGLWMRYHIGGHALPEGMQADGVFPYFIQSALPRPIAGLVVAAVLSAAMSTIDSSLNATSTVVLVDVVRHFRQGPGRIPEIYILRGATILSGMIGTGAATILYLSLGGQEARTVMDVWWQYAGVAGGGLFGLFLLAWLAPKVPAWGAALGVVGSLPVLIWGTLARKLADDSALKPYECTLHPNLIGIAGTCVLLGIAIATLGGARMGFWRENGRG